MVPINRLHYLVAMHKKISAEDGSDGRKPGNESAAHLIRGQPACGRRIWCHSREESCSCHSPKCLLAEESMTYSLGSERRLL
jgi:hypothetical protein